MQRQLVVPSAIHRSLPSRPGGGDLALARRDVAGRTVVLLQAKGGDAGVVLAELWMFSIRAPLAVDELVVITTNNGPGCPPSIVARRTGWRWCLGIRPPDVPEAMLIVYNTLAGRATPRARSNNPRSRPARRARNAHIAGTSSMRSANQSPQGLHVWRVSLYPPVDPCTWRGCSGPRQIHLFQQRTARSVHRCQDRKPSARPASSAARATTGAQASWKVPTHMPPERCQHLFDAHAHLFRCFVGEGDARMLAHRLTVAINQAMRCTNTRVLPLPAPARISACGSAVPRRVVRR